MRYRVAAHNAGFSSSAIASLFRLFLLFFLFGQRIRLFPRKTRGIPCEVRAQRGARRGRELSDCRHLHAGLSLINDGNIPPYTVTRPRPTRERPSPSVVYKRYYRCDAAQLPCLLLRHQVRPSTRNTVTRPRISADLWLSAKSFSSKSVSTYTSLFFESNLRWFYTLQIELLNTIFIELLKIYARLYSIYYEYNDDDDYHDNHDEYFLLINKYL